jgi:hypothetical protein
MNVQVIMSDNRDVEFDLKNCEYNTLSAIINYKYSYRHKYDFKYFQPLMNEKVELANCLSPNKKPRHAAWSKILSCIKVIEEGCKYDFVVYLDSDCVFNYQETSLINYLDQSKNVLNENLNINSNIFFMNNQPWHRFLPCSGFFIFRPNSTALDFFKSWYQQNQDDEYNLNHPWEQHCLQNYLSKTFQFEIIDDWMFEDKKQNQYLRHIGRGNSLRKTFFSKIVDTYELEKVKSNLNLIKESIVTYKTNNTKWL